MVSDQHRRWSLAQSEEAMESQPAHILIADDEVPIRLTMESLLRHRGYAVTVAEDGAEALELLHQYSFDLLLLDLKMPQLSGVEVAQRARELQPHAVVIILTGHGSLESAIEGMHLGVFDYLLKTSSPQEVLSRIAQAIEQQQRARHEEQLVQRLQAVMRELQGEAELEPPRPSANRIVVGDLEISTWNQGAQFDGRKLSLTPTEFRILVCLAQHAGQALSCQQIVQFAQGYSVDLLEAVELLKPHIHHLRQKIEPDPANPRYILTVRGNGYLLVATPRAQREQEALIGHVL
jgi:DNA-binding response OmpR family regulator